MDNKFQGRMMSVNNKLMKGNPSGIKERILILLPLILDCCLYLINIFMDDNVCMRFEDERMFSSLGKWIIGSYHLEVEKWNLVKHKKQEVKMGI